MKTKTIYLLMIMTVVAGTNVFAQQNDDGETEKKSKKAAAASPCANEKVLANLLKTLNGQTETAQLLAAERLAECGTEAADAMERLGELTEARRDDIRIAARKAFMSVSGQAKPAARKNNDGGAQNQNQSSRVKPVGVETLTSSEDTEEEEEEEEEADESKLGLSAKVVDRAKWTLRIQPKEDVSEKKWKNYVIEIENGDKKTSEKRSKRKETPQEEEIDLTEGDNIIVVRPDTDDKKELKKFTARTVVKCENCKKEKDASGQSEYLRSIVGFEQVGASSAGSRQQPFLNFFFNAPLIRFGKKCADENNCQPEEIRKQYQFSFWGDVRLTTTAVQTIAALPSLADTLRNEDTSKANELAQSFDFLVGLEQEIIPRNRFFSGLFKAKTSVSLIAAGGAINPLSSERSATFYKVPQALVNGVTTADPRFLEAFPEAKGKANVAFVSPERDRFFRQYYGGLRFKTFFYNDDETPKNLFPAMFDFTFGQNEAITNKLKGVIMRLDGSTPFPIRGANFVYLFGSVQMKLGSRVNQTIPSFFLEPATGTNLTNSDTVIIPIDRSPFLRSNRDTFKIGVGIDLLKIFTEKKSEK